MSQFFCTRDISGYDLAPVFVQVFLIEGIRSCKQCFSSCRLREDGRTANTPRHDQGGGILRATWALPIQEVEIGVWYFHFASGEDAEEP